MTQMITIKAGALGLALGLPEAGQPVILSCGRAASASAVWADVPRSSRINGMDDAVAPAVLLPTGHMGHFGWPAIAGHRAGRHFTLQFSGWRQSAEGKATILSGHDAVADLDLTIRIMAESDGVISMATTLVNTGTDVYSLDRCMAGSFLVGGGQAEVTGYTGMWGREFQTRTFSLPHGMWMQESRRGRTSHDRFPILAIATKEESLSFHIGWSGNHLMAIETLDDNRRLVHLGEVFEPGEMLLAPGEAYHSPKAYMGLDANAFCAYVRHHLVTWPGGTMRPRPVTLNTWEGNYFDHKMDSLKAQADAAAKLGIERFVLDDGWFGRRDDDTTSLGDWYVDERKYPKGLGELVDHVVGLGMEFGIWFEPEMVNPVSDLYKAHPDWILKVDGRPILLSRNQLVLDLTRKEVSDYLYDCMAKVLKAHKISYIKWDMNRDLTHPGGADGRAMTARQTRAVYALMARIRADFPDVEIESCASGGGRIDYGVLEHTQRVWTSDCTDAFERLEIQRGARSFMPPELLGSHVSASPNHQTHRVISLGFRSLVAMAYHFGVELNPVELNQGEFAELSNYIALHKKLRPLLHGDGGQFHLEPADGRYVWGAVGADKIVAIVAQGPLMVGEYPEPLRLPVDGAKPGTWRIAAIHPMEPDMFRISDGQRKLLDGELTFDLDTLSRAGLPIPMLRPLSGFLIEIERTGEDKTHG